MCTNRTLSPVPSTAYRALPAGLRSLYNTTITPALHPHLHTASSDHVNPKTNVTANPDTRHGTITNVAHVTNNPTTTSDTTTTIPGNIHGTSNGTTVPLPSTPEHPQARSVSVVLSPYGTLYRPLPDPSRRLPGTLNVASVSLPDLDTLHVASVSLPDLDVGVFSSDTSSSTNIGRPIGLSKDRPEILPSEFSPSFSQPSSVHVKSVMHDTRPSLHVTQCTPDLIPAHTALQSAPIQKNTSNFSLLSSQPFLGWAGLPIGTSAGLALYLRAPNASPLDLEVSINSGVKDNPRSSVFRLLKHESQTVNTLENTVMVTTTTVTDSASTNQLQEAVVSVLFEPQDLSFSRALLMIKPLGKTLVEPAFCIPMLGYGGTSRVEILGIRTYYFYGIRKEVWGRVVRLVFA